MSVRYSSSMPEVISVTELNTRVKELFLKTPTLNDIWVSGEISGLRKYPSGYYFVLKDATSEIHAVMFNSARMRMDFEPQENMKVRAFGNIGMYVPKGTYQFIVEVMEKSGLGDRYIAFEALKKRLGEEGLFDASHKRELPPYPRRIGVVTSQSGAVIHDIIMTSATRFTADIILAPAKVQGEGAAESIVEGIRILNAADVDVIIVGRGGGSIEDLWAFNEEIVARAIYNSKVPIVSAVGHETDFTIADFVADVRAPTPTGAAAIILRDRTEIGSEIDSLSARLTKAMQSELRLKSHAFEILDSKLDLKAATEELNLYSMRLDDLMRTAEHCIRTELSEDKGRFATADARLRPSKALEDIDSLRKRVEVSLDRVRLGSLSTLDNRKARMEGIKDGPDRAIMSRFQDLDSRLQSDSKMLDGLNPMNVLTRGYSMITSEEGKVLTAIDDIEIGGSVTIHMRDGEADARITDKEKRT